MAVVSSEDLQHLAEHGFVVVKDFLSEDLQAGLVNDVKALRSNSKFKIAKIGHDGLVQDENAPYRDVRLSETCFIGRSGEDKDMPQNVNRKELYAVLEQVRSDLGSETLSSGTLTRGLPTLDNDMEELMYAYYPTGGYYRRHKDAEVASPSNWRKYSFLIYLNQDWTPKDGGHLRIHLDSGDDKLPSGELPNFQDVDPRGGTLVIFRSDLVPHEVLDTQSERIAIVGWYLSSQIAAPSLVPDFPVKSIDALTLAALRALREGVPGLTRKLSPMSDPVSQQHSSGLLGDDFLFPSTSSLPPAEKKVEYDDSDPRYWATIATFNVLGQVSTLSLRGQRLRKIEGSLLSEELMRSVNVLDLGNADFPVPSLLVCLQKSTNLKLLHLAGNAYGDKGVSQLCDGAAATLQHLQTLDLRYNDLTEVGVAAIGDLLQSNNCMLEVLHLEGNSLRCEAAAGLSRTGRLRELYLGHNDIGPDGAAALAKGLHHGQLKKLYLETNCIGPMGAAALSAALLDQGDNKKLEKLFVDNNGIGKEEAQRLARAVNSVTVITDSVFS